MAQKLGIDDRSNSSGNLNISSAERYATWLAKAALGQVVAENANRELKASDALMRSLPIGPAAITVSQAIASGLNRKRGLDFRRVGYPPGEHNLEPKSSDVRPLNEQERDMVQRSITLLAHSGERVAAESLTKLLKAGNIRIDPFNVAAGASGSTQPPLFPFKLGFRPSEMNTSHIVYLSPKLFDKKDKYIYGVDSIKLGGTLLHEWAHTTHGPLFGKYHAEPVEIGAWKYQIDWLERNKNNKAWGRDINANFWSVRAEAAIEMESNYGVPGPER